MSFSVAIDIQREFVTSCAPADVFGFLADVPRSASCFPKVNQLVNLGENCFRWEMEKIGIGSYTLQQTIYACRYIADAAARKVSWLPVSGVGNALVEGEWLMIPKDNGASVILNTKGELTVDFPSFLQFIISPLVVMEFTGMIEQYLTNLKEAFTKL
jgi:carbon monoxide dehydrogenase subunit G